MTTSQDNQLRIMVVDDSLAVQRLVTAVLNAEPDVRVVGVAEDGSKALGLLAQCQPDVMVLDLEMPGMDGAATFARLEVSNPDLPVVVFTGAVPPTEGELANAITRGDVTTVTKPTGVTDLSDAFARMRSSLLPAIRSASQRSQSKTKPVPATNAPAKQRPRQNQQASHRSTLQQLNQHRPLGRRPAQQRSTKPSPVSRRPPQQRRGTGRPTRVDALLIGSSTGGPKALDDFLSHLREPLPVPTFIVQHIGAKFGPDLVRRLDKHKAPTFEAADGETPQPGCVYVASGSQHLKLVSEGSRGVVMRLTDDKPVNSCRPAVDVLFESAAEVYGPFQVGIIMTGMGEDGLAGCKQLAEKGATIMAQDEQTSVIWGMPGAVARAGLADHTIPVTEMAQLLNGWLIPRISRPLDRPVKPAADRSSN
ncbi:MAG: chemotaxis-specific protein-glutamate methyltransferase CheB [Acidimicrobiales bacterium]